MAARSIAYHAHGTTGGDKSCCYPWLVCHDINSAMHCSLRLAPTMINHLTSTQATWFGYQTTGKDIQVEIKKFYCRRIIGSSASELLECLQIMTGYLILCTLVRWLLNSNFVKPWGNLYRCHGSNREYTISPFGVLQAIQHAVITEHFHYGYKFINKSIGKLSLRCVRDSYCVVVWKYGTFTASLTSLGHSEGQWVDLQNWWRQNRTVQLGIARVTALSSKTDVEPSRK